MGLSLEVQERRERDLCFRCLKPKLTCYCSQVRAFSVKPCFVLLQHPIERKRSVGTARMAHLCIKNSQLIPGREFDHNLEVNRLIDDPGNYCVVLYPGPKSRDIGLASGSEISPAHLKLVIFVIDGTWGTAKTMLNKSERLLKLPRICFTPERESEYKFRQQPEKHCLSTIEAVHRMIELLDPSASPGNLLEVFRSMVEQQVRFSKAGNIRKLKGNKKDGDIKTVKLD